MQYTSKSRETLTSSAALTGNEIATQTIRQQRSKSCAERGKRLLQFVLTGENAAERGGVRKDLS
ncbi:MAG: hypothetical protein HKN47_20515 [Pirellulaceae bacterium]|nr:hypothetical protein [Pirellulaceae bacterium]